jgi:tetratricopeptide (TPR) repeat protein
MARKKTRPEGISPLWPALALAAITLAVFAGVAGHDFVGVDDDRYVFDNLIVSRGLTAEGLGWALTTYNVVYWHPITWLSHMADCQLYGLKAGGNHITNLLLHTGSVVFLFLLLRRTTGATWRSAVVAALFGVHPLRVESVAWVAERKDVLVCLFWLLTLWTYVSYARAAPEKRKRRYAAVVAMCVATAMCKPAVVTLPCVMLLLDWWPLERLDGSNWWARVKEKLPLLALSLVSSVLTYQGQKEFGAMRDLARVDLPVRIANAMVAYVLYVRDTFWPATLAIPYPYRTDIPAAAVLFSAALLAAITWFVIRQARRRYLAVGWFWFLGVLVPMIGIVQVGAQSRADRFTYIPSIGLLVLIVWGAAELAARYRVPRSAAATVAAVAIAGLGARAWAQVPLWRNTITLLEHSTAVTTGNDLAHFNLGWQYLVENRPVDAERQFRIVMALSPDAVNFQAGLANALYAQQKYGEALAIFDEVLRRDPDYPAALAGRALALKRLGQSGEALDAFQKAIARGLPAKQAAEARNEAAGLLAAAGRLPEAMAELRRALEINPRLSMARMNLARALAALGQGTEARTQLETLLAADPEYPGARELLGQLR